MKKYKTGNRAPKSGQYRALGTKREITMVRGKRIPPYQGKARNYKLTDKTKHKRGR